MTSCPNCGADLDSSDRICPSCGHAIVDHDSDRRDGEGADSDDGAVAADETGQGPDRVDIPANPHELDVFEFSFKYPLANGFRPIALAGLLLLGSFLVLPVLVFAGYQYRMGRSAAAGRSSPPRLDDFWGLAVDGIRLFVVVGIAALAVVAVTVGLFHAGLEALAFAWNSLASFLLAPLTPVFYGTGSVRETYANARFLHFLGEVEFWIGFAYQLGISFVLYIAFFVITILVFIPVVGILAVVPSAFSFVAIVGVVWLPFALLVMVYATVVQAALWGRIYRDAAADGAVDEVHDPDRIASTW